MDVLDGGAYWRNLANTIELSVCGGDAAFLSNYVDLLFLFLLPYVGETKIVEMNAVVM